MYRDDINEWKVLSMGLLGVIVVLTVGFSLYLLGGREQTRERELAAYESGRIAAIWDCESAQEAGGQSLVRDEGAGCRAR